LLFTSPRETIAAPTPNEIAISPDGSRAYVASNLNHTVTVINIRTNEVMMEIPTGGQPVSVDVTPDNRHVYVSIQSSNVISVIDAESQTVMAVLPGGSSPGSVKVTPILLF
jgi:YVTN family beta-propeller protein